MKTIEELQQENKALQYKLNILSRIIEYNNAECYSLRKHNHFLVLANRIYVAAIVIVIIGFIVGLLLL